MKEKLLQFIWQYLYFNIRDLRTYSGEYLQIIYPGIINKNQGPDFINARIKVEGTLWAGNIEIHVKASEWNLHKHSLDDHYSNVILHVVWENDLKDQLPFPTLELCGRVSGMMLVKYEQLMHSPSFIPCEKNIVRVDDIVLLGLKQRLIIERFETRTEAIMLMLQKAKGHWGEVFWWKLARNFGIIQNADSFERIAQSIPVNLIRRSRFNCQQLEALLFGQASLLDLEYKDKYAQILQRDYKHISRKYSLVRPRIPIYFLRMRPATFPTVRLAQLAAVLHSNLHLFSQLWENGNLPTVLKMFDVTASEYWNDHYLLDVKAKFSFKRVGDSMTNNILLNTVLPVMFAYGHYHGLISLKETIIDWMMQLPPESNKITEGFKKCGLNIISAFDSQSLLQLNQEYCNKRRCLHCTIGCKIMKI